MGGIDDVHGGDVGGGGLRVVQATAEEQAAIRGLLSRLAESAPPAAGVGRAPALAWAGLRLAAFVLLAAGIQLGYADGDDLDEVGCTVAQKPGRAAHGKTDTLKAEMLRSEGGGQGPEHPTSNNQHRTLQPEDGGLRTEDGGTNTEHRTSNIQPRTPSVGEEGKASQGKAEMLKAETLKAEDGGRKRDCGTTGQRAEDGGASIEHRTSSIQPRTVNVGERGKAEGPAREHREVMEALREIRDGLEAVRRSAGQEEPISRSEAQRIFAVLQRLRSKRAGMMAPLYDVFVATVLEGRSQRAAAKSCDCSPALLSKRVGELEEEFELPLQQLQNYAKPLLEMETSVKGQRYARKKRGAPQDEPAQYADDDLPEERQDDT